MTQLTRDYVLSSIDELIVLGKNALRFEFHEGIPGKAAYLEGSNYKMFVPKLKILTERVLKEHPLYYDICKEINSFESVESTRRIVQYLGIVKTDVVFLEQFKEYNNNSKDTYGIADKEKNVFIVYGHDETALKDAESFLLRIHYQPIILRDEPSEGLTVIEKIEKYADDVVFAIVLYTACDEGRLREHDEKLKHRARQNVVFEHGYLISKLSRKRVVALVEKEVETPGDMNGVVYVSMSDDDWRQQIMKEMVAVGLVIDNKLDAGVGSIKPEKKTAEHKEVIKHQSTTSYSNVMLFFATEDNGLITVSTTFGGTSFVAGKNPLNASHELRELAKWKAAVEELQNRGFIKRVSSSSTDQIYEVTAKGFANSDDFKKNNKIDNRMAPSSILAMLNK